ncbi:hypothetical protein FH551_23890 [Salmonella enterica]|nr:hypothetical protein [Salmonella enterica]
MKNIRQLYFEVKKKMQKALGIAGGTIWREVSDDPDEDDAKDTFAIKAAGFKRSDFFKPVRVDHLVVDDMPAEGVFDTAFCDRYKLAEDGKSWLLPAAQPNPTDSSGTDINNQEQGNENTTSITDSGDTASAAVTDSETTVDTETSVSDEADTDSASDVNVNGEPMADVEKGMDWPMKDLSLPVRWMAQKGMDSKVLFLKPAERERLTKILEADDENNSQHLTNIKAVTTDELAPEIDKLTTYHLHRLVTAFDKVSEKVERMGPFLAKRFVQAWLDTEYIDQGILVNEWCAGRRVSRIETQKTPAVEAVETAYPRRSEAPTHRTINTEIACALIPGADPCNLRSVLKQAQDIMRSGREDWKRWSITLGITPEIKSYSRQTIFDVVRKAPAAVHNGSPELRRTWCESFLAVHGVRDPDWYEPVSDEAPTTHEENSKRVRQAGKHLRDIQAGKFDDDEAQQQPTGALADEPPAPEAVEQNTTEHHPDPQPLENEPLVSQTEAGYQKIRAELHEARKNILPKNPVDVGKQLAAARGEFIEGISDPDDPKWVRDDYSASNEGEKVEMDTDSTADATDYVDHQEEFSNQPEPETNHSESVADQIEPEAPETEPKSQKPEPVTKVADGVFDVSAFFADTSNQGEKTEVTPLNNDDRTTKQSEEKSPRKEPEQALSPAPEFALTPEVLLLLQQINQTLQQIMASHFRIEKAHRKDAAAIRGMLAMMYATETEEEADHGE